MNPEILCVPASGGQPVYVRWNTDSTIAGTYQTSQGTVIIKHGHLVAGKSAGVEIVFADTGVARTVLLASRGMGIWKAWVGDVEFGWASANDGPVHPSLVPVFDPDGLGWLEGFDEFVVRCGLESNGAPEMNENGLLRYPLHGRVANLPATNLQVVVDEASGAVEVIGEVIESKLFFKKLVLRSRTRFYAGSSSIDIIDEVTNDRSVPATMQLLYHINVGVPVLSAGSTIDLAFDEFAPKDPLSASEINTWHEIGEPQSGYSERVYFSKASQKNPRSIALLSNDATGLGVAVEQGTDNLPHFIVWKNPAAQQDGYVVGLEPATNFPNTKTFEQSQGRVVTLTAGETKRFELSLHLLTTSDAIAKQRLKLASVKATSLQKLNASPKPGWSNV